MRNFLYLIILAVLFVSCSDNFLQRTPSGALTAKNYFKNEKQLKTYTNSFYSMINPYSDVIYEFADNAANFNPSEKVKGTRTVPATGGGWSWGNLRNINYFLNNLNEFNGPTAVENKYEGVARFFRALFYFRKVKRFGAVPWYSKVIKTTDKNALHKKRDPRNVVMDSILTDLNFAINNLGEEKNVTKATKWTALALKSRVMLYAGTWRKYHDLGKYKKWLKECVNASEKLMKSNEYGIYTDNGNINDAYRKLFISNKPETKEVIMAQLFDESIPYTSGINFRTNSSSYGRPGVTKDLVNSYLMDDGTRFTDKSNYNKKTFYEETRKRDPRLAQTIVTPGFVRKGETKPTVPDFTASLTGYQYIKFVQSPPHYNNGNDNAIPVFRYAEVLLNFAEAKAELETITQNDLDNSIRIIRSRVGMPNINMSHANANPDPYLEKEYPNVKGSNEGVILEIRRERRIELVREGFRWDDLMRWADGPKVANTFKGMYFSGPGKFDLDQNGTIDLVIYKGSKPSSTISGAQYRSLNSMNLTNGTNGGLMEINADIGKKWTSPKDYLYPIPTQDLQLNPNLKQNPGWSKP
jgi:hypothetical protein